jgi:RNA polymerase sigma factor (sigma-70 family)
MAADLWQKYQLDRSTFNRNKLVEANLLLVWDVIAKRFGSFGNDADDLYQVGVIGLIKAVERFDFSQGYKFSSYAAAMIAGEIQHYFRDKWEVIRSPRGAKHQPVFSIDAQVVFDSGEWIDWIDALVDRVQQPEDWSDLLSAIKLLPEQHRIAIELHFVEAADGSRLNRKQVAEKLGVAPMTITRWFIADIEKLRGILSAS